MHSEKIQELRTYRVIRADQERNYFQTRRAITREPRELPKIIRPFPIGFSGRACSRGILQVNDGVIDERTAALVVSANFEFRTMVVRTDGRRDVRLKIGGAAGI